jgi:hypothetical protein
VKITCSFYIGHQDYILEDPNLPESESKQKLYSEVFAVLDKNIGSEQFEIYQAKNATELRAVLHSDDEAFQAYGFSTDVAVADGEEGLPVLFYVNAHFEIPEIADIDDFDGEVDAVLYVGEHTLKFEGLAEINGE